MTNQSTETNSSAEKLKGTFVKRERDQEGLKCHRRVKPKRSLHFKYQSIMEQHNGISFTQYTQTLDSNSRRHFIENHFFCRQKSRPVFCHLAPTSLFCHLAPTSLSFKYHSEVKQHLSNVSLRIPCK